MLGEPHTSTSTFPAPSTGCPIQQGQQLRHNTGLVLPLSISPWAQSIHLDSRTWV